MSAYVVLARKWRSAQFPDIVGQHAIVRTLMNAIRAGRVHQAYLFTGSRGIGKTSIARIFAKVLRCEHTKTVERPGPDGQPAESWLVSCDECASCREITSSTSVDVMEIDGASNNGVEAVREIRESAKYMPSTGSRKIYIIDEVHMLTTAAFNALLKTLEEPPPHVTFIFATTEPHKIPATILSRCQRFDFRRYTAAQIQAHLAEIARAEKFEAEAGALSLIARAAEGSMRDALSLLDQVIAFSSGGRITTESVRESVGLIEGQTLLGILAGIFRRKPLEALRLVDQAYQRGHDLRVLTRGLIEMLHGAILAKVGAPNSALLELSAEEWQELRTLSTERSLEELELIFQALHHGLDWVARSPQPKVVLDILLVKCAMADALVQVSANPAAGGSPGVTSKPGASVATARAIAEPSASPATPPGAPATDTSLQKTPPQTQTASPAPTAPPISTTPSVPNPAAATAAPTWEGLIGHVRKTRPLLASILENASSDGLKTLEALGEGSAAPSLSVVFSPENAYFKEQLQSPAYHTQLSTFCLEYFGKPTRVVVELNKSGGESLATKRKRETDERERTARQAAQNHPILMEARSLFGGELGPIETLESRNAET